jgi:hypothetical protein
MTDTNAAVLTASLQKRADERTCDRATFYTISEPTESDKRHCLDKVNALYITCSDRNFLTAVVVQFAVE